MTKEQKINCVALKVSFLMEHQKVLPDLKEIIQELEPEDSDDVETRAYLQGAYDALMLLISHLETKG